MEHIPRSEAKVVRSGTVVALEYETTSETLNLAFIKINGRYPDTGFTSNTESDSLVQVSRGNGILGLSDGTMIELDIGDQIHLATGDQYFFEGSLEIYYAATPKWTPEQTKHHI